MTIHRDWELVGAVATLPFALAQSMLNALPAMVNPFRHRHPGRWRDERWER